MKDLKITVNGQEVKLTDFPREMITNLVLAMLRSLKGVDEPVKNVVIELQEKD